MRKIPTRSSQRNPPERRTHPVGPLALPQDHLLIVEIEARGLAVRIRIRDQVHRGHGIVAAESVVGAAEPQNRAAIVEQHVNHASAGHQFTCFREIVEKNEKVPAEPSMSGVPMPASDSASLGGR